MQAVLCQARAEAESCLRRAEAAEARLSAGIMRTTTKDCNSSCLADSFAEVYDIYRMCLCLSVCMSCRSLFAPLPLPLFVRIRVCVRVHDCRVLSPPPSLSLSLCLSLSLSPLALFSEREERERERGTYSSPRKPQNVGGPHGPGSLTSSSNPKEEEERERERALCP